jgi:hypothetical protein
MTDPDFTGLPDHPSLEVTRAMGRALFTGLPEVISMETVNIHAKTMDELFVGPNVEVVSRDELVRRWSQTGMYEGGIDYERPEPPSGADGLVVVEFKEEPSSP